MGAKPRLLSSLPSPSSSLVGLTSLPENLPQSLHGLEKNPQRSRGPGHLNVRCCAFVPHVWPSEEESWGTIFLELKTVATDRHLGSIVFGSFILKVRRLVSSKVYREGRPRSSSLGLQPDALICHSNIIQRSNWDFLSPHLRVVRPACQRESRASPVSWVCCWKEAAAPLLVA